MKKRLFVSILIALITNGLISAQNASSVSKIMIDNFRDINFESSVGWYISPTYYISTTISNSFLVFKYVTYETVVTKEKPVYHEENVTHTVSVNLLKLASITKEHLSITDHNSYLYGIRIDVYEDVSITKDKSQHKGPSTYSINHYTLACRTAELQERLISALKQCTETYTHKVPQNETSLLSCYSELHDLLNSYKLTRSKPNGWSDEKIDVNNLKISYKDNKLKLAFTSYDCRDCYGRKKINIELTIPINDIQCLSYKSLSDGYIKLISSDNITCSENGSTTIISEYKFCGDVAVCKKICQALNAFIDGIKLLNYEKSIGSQIVNKKKGNKSNTTPQKKISKSFGQ